MPISLTHDEAKIEAAGMNQQPLQHVRLTAQMRTPHSARVIEMRERAFDRLAASAHQPPAAASANPPAIAIHRRLGVGSSDQSRRPRSGSAIYDRIPTASRSTIVWLL